MSTFVAAIGKKLRAFGRRETLRSPLKRGTLALKGWKIGNMDAQKPVGREFGLPTVICIEKLEKSQETSFVGGSDKSRILSRLKDCLSDSNSLFIPH